jgi:hypothetical protein
MESKRNPGALGAAGGKRNKCTKSGTIKRAVAPAQAVYVLRLRCRTVTIFAGCGGC